MATNKIRNQAKPIFKWSGLDLCIEEDSCLGGNIYQGDPYSYAPRVWQYLLDRFAARTVLDLGSGIGHAAFAFSRMGAIVVAVDGSPENISQSIYPAVCHDLRISPIRCVVDLVHCQEVVEHIEAEHVGNVVSSLCSGRVICMTHALPGQPGHNHVNCQPESYWVELLRQAGYNLLVEDTDRVRRIAQMDGAYYLGQTGLVFARRGDSFR